eukprot:734400-Rhodomonas_salina.1
MEEPPTEEQLNETERAKSNSYCDMFGWNQQMSYPPLKTYGLTKKDTGAKPTGPQQKISFKLAAKKQKRM